MNTSDTAVPIVLAGARGHGRWHLDNIRRLQDKGIVRLAGVCELTPLTAAELPEGSARPSSPPTSARCWRRPAPASPSSAPRSPPTPTSR